MRRRSHGGEELVMRRHLFLNEGGRQQAGIWERSAPDQPWQTMIYRILGIRVVSLKGNESTRSRRTTKMNCIRHFLSSTITCFGRTETNQEGSLLSLLSLVQIYCRARAFSAKALGLVYYYSNRWEICIQSPAREEARR